MPKQDFRYNRIFIPVEIFNRELVPKVIFGVFLASKGFSVVIGHKWHVLNLARRYGVAGDVFFEKNAESMEGTEHLREFKSRGMYLIGIDEEAGLNFSDYSAYAQDFGMISGVKIFDIWLAWGKRDFSFLSMSTPNTKVLNIGTPRSMLWNSDAEIVFSEEVKELQRTHRNYILIATSFVWENALPSAAFISEIYSSFGQEYEDNMSKIISKGIENQTDFKNYQKLVELIDKLLKETECEILIRPHPMEAKENARKIERYSNRIFVKNQGPSTPLIAGASLVIHMGSTVAVEAKGLGVTVVNLEDAYNLIKSNQSVKALWKLDRTENAEDLVKKNSVFNFCENFADECLNKIIMPSQVPSLEKIHSSLRGIIGTYIHRPRSSEMSLFDHAKRPSITKAKAWTLIHKAVKILRINQSVRLRMIGKSTFEIQIKSELARNRT